eukprot:g10845.t1
MAADLPGCVLYFFLFMSLGSILPYLPVIWGSKGLSDDEIGLLAAVRPIAIIVVGPLICAFGDKHGIQLKILYGMIVLFAITTSSVLVAGNFLTLAAVEASSAICESPILSLVDSSVRKSFGAGGYGSQRMWGAVGYGFAVLLSGVVYDITGAGYGSVVVVFFVALVLALAAAVGGPVGTADEPARGKMKEGNRDRCECRIEMTAKGGPDRAGKTSESDDNTRTTSRGQAADLDGSGHSSNGWHWEGRHHTFLFVWLDELGGSHVVFGLAGLIMCAAEVPFFFLSGSLIRMIGPRNVVALSQIGYIFRFGYYSVLQDPWWVLPVEVVHGLTFAAMWAATTDYAHGIAPAHMRTTMQATVSALKRGLGYGLGALLGGILYSNLGPRLCFRVSAALPSLSLLFLAIGSRTKRKLGGGRWWDYNEEGTEDGLEGWGGDSAQRVPTSEQDLRPARRLQ